MREIKSEGKTIKEAIEKALEILNLTRDQVEVEIIQEEKKGILGIGAKNACVLVREKIWTNNPTADLEKNSLITQEKTEKTSKLQSESFNLKNYNLKFNPTNNLIEDAKNLLLQIMQLSGIKCNIIEAKYDETKKLLYINFSTPDSGLFLHNDAKTLMALQYLISSILNKNSKETILIKLDTADFWSKTEARLKRDVDRAISFIKKTGKAYRLRPMPSQMRKYIHDLIKEKYPDFTTISEGENKWRKVVIKPKK